MTSISAFEAKTRFGDLLQRVRRGEGIRGGRLGGSFMGSVSAVQPGCRVAAR
jgi:hypothetical protein